MPTAASSSSLLLLALACLALPVVVLSSCEYEEALLVDAHRAKSELWRGKTRGGDDADDAVDADAASGLGSCAGMRWDLKKLSLRVRKYESLLSLFVCFPFVCISFKKLFILVVRGPCAAARRPRAALPRAHDRPAVRQAEAEGRQPR
jgi:hypothetical protein